MATVEQINNRSLDGVKKTMKKKTNRPINQARPVNECLKEIPTNKKTRKRRKSTVEQFVYLLSEHPRLSTVLKHGRFSGCRPLSPHFTVLI